MSSEQVTDPSDTSLVISVREIITAASEHDIQTLEKLVNEKSFPDCKAVDVQDPETGFSPLHAVINGSQHHSNETEQDATARENHAVEVIRFLLENGAIWNQLDRQDETPACIAHRLALEPLYQLIVDAGVRAELLLSRLEEYDRLEDNEENGAEEEGNDTQDDGTSDHGSLAQVPDVNSSSYLVSTLSMSGKMLLDGQQNGVMMAWESDIMSQSANTLLTRPGLRVLNIGFGMGIIDTHIQNHTNKPASHHIIEAHPEVLGDMETKGWMGKSGVVVHRGKWQDILPTLVMEGCIFDAIYFDTFAETYSEFRDFFSEQVIGLLDQEGRWSFFNGMGADRQISYDVYQKVVELDLFESGFDVEWVPVQLPKLDAEWEGVRRKYWNIDSYRLPISKFMD